MFTLRSSLLDTTVFPIEDFTAYVSKRVQDAVVTQDANCTLRMRVNSTMYNVIPFIERSVQYTVTSRENGNVIEFNVTMPIASSQSVYSLLTSASFRNALSAYVSDPSVRVTALSEYVDVSVFTHVNVTSIVMSYMKAHNGTALSRGHSRLEDAIEKSTHVVFIAVVVSFCSFVVVLVCVCVLCRGCFVGGERRKDTAIVEIKKDAAVVEKKKDAAVGGVANPAGVRRVVWRRMRL